MNKTNGTVNDDKHLEPEDFPGYPPYPPEDDIVRHATRVEGNLGDDGFESIEQAKATFQQQPPPTEADTPPERTADDFEVTDDDLQALGPVDLSMDLGEDEQLKQRTHPVDFAGDNLDVPGSEDDDKAEEIGSEDEENNAYSLGGDLHSE